MKVIISPKANDDFDETYVDVEVLSNYTGNFVSLTTNKLIDQGNVSIVKNPDNTYANIHNVEHASFDIFTYDICNDTTLRSLHIQAMSVS